MITEIIKIVKEINTNTMSFLKETSDLTFIFSNIENEFIEKIYSKKNELINEAKTNHKEYQLLKEEIHNTEEYICQFKNSKEIYNIEDTKNMIRFKAFNYSLNSYKNFLDRTFVRVKEQLEL